MPFERRSLNFENLLFAPFLPHLFAFSWPASLSTSCEKAKKWNKKCIQNQTIKMQRTFLNPSRIKKKI